MKIYNNSIDFFKGTLIISVFLGHLIVGKTSDVFVRSFIYSFHMPLFIGLSGYLFNFEFLNNFPKKSFKKILQKIIVPYISAVIFYCILINFKFILNYDIYSFIVNFFKNAIYSYYHLWYIQGYLSYIIISYILTKKFKTHTIIIFSIILSLVIYYFYFFYRSDNPILMIFLNNFRLYNLIFFIVGLYVKQQKFNIKLNNKNWMIFIGLFIVNSILGFYMKNQYIIELFFYLSNIFSIIFLLKLCEEYPNFKINCINFMGNHSLYFYLWHILPLIILRKITLDKNIYLYYFLGVVSFYLLYLILRKYFQKK